LCPRCSRLNGNQPAPVFFPHLTSLNALGEKVGEKYIISYKKKVDSKIVCIFYDNNIHFMKYIYYII